MRAASTGAGSTLAGISRLVAAAQVSSLASLHTQHVPCTLIWQTLPRIIKSLDPNRLCLQQHDTSPGKL